MPNGNAMRSKTAIRKREEPLYHLIDDLCAGIDRQPDEVLVELIRHVDRSSRHAQGRSNALKATFLHALQSALETYRLGIDYSGYEARDDEPCVDDDRAGKSAARRVRWPADQARERA
jgi:hypothetical protein